MFGEDGQCFWCREEITPEQEARVANDKLLLKKLRAKLKRINSKNKKSLKVMKPQTVEDDE
jgi:hypothetical protein